MALRQTIRWSDWPRNPFCNNRFYSKTFINICMSRCVWIKIKNVGCALILACGARETRGIWPRAILNYWTPFQIESLTHPQHLRQATIDFSCEMKNRDKDPQKLRLKNIYIQFFRPLNYYFFNNERNSKMWKNIHWEIHWEIFSRRIVVEESWFQIYWIIRFIIRLLEIIATNAFFQSKKLFFTHEMILK